MLIPILREQCGLIIKPPLENINPSGYARNIPDMQERSLKSGGRNGLLTDIRSQKRQSRLFLWRTTAILAPTLKITVKSTAGEKFDRITKYVLGERPPMREPGDDIAEMYDDPPTNSPQDLGVYDDIPF